jgi:hypothetical protein
MFFVPSINFVGGALATHADTTAWVNAVIANGGTVSSGREALVNALISGLDTDGVWSQLDRLFLLAAENATSALTDLKGLDLATAVNSPTFTTDTGYSGNGTTSYINSNYNPATDATNFAQDSAHLGVWNNTSRGDASTVEAGGGPGGGGGYSAEMEFRTPGSTNVRINSVGATNPSGGGFKIANTQIFFVGNRVASPDSELYVDGATLASTNFGGTTSIAVPTGDIFICARNTGGGPDAYSSDQLSAVTLGGGLTSGDVADLYTHLRTYMTAVGVP